MKSILSYVNGSIVEKQVKDVRRALELRLNPHEVLLPVILQLVFLLVDFDQKMSSSFIKKRLTLYTFNMLSIDINH